MCPFCNQTARIQDGEMVMIVINSISFKNKPKLQTLSNLRTSSLPTLSSMTSTAAKDRQTEIFEEEQCKKVIHNYTVF